MTRPAICRSGSLEQRGQRAQFRAPVDHREVFEQQQKGHRADQRHEVIGAAHPAIGEALDDERKHGAARRAHPDTASGHGNPARMSAQVAMPPTMNSPGMLKLRNFSTPMHSVSATATIA